MPNKFLVETALDVGIDNLKKLRNTDPKALYDEVKSSIGSEPSPEIKKLYQRYIDLYDQSVQSTSAKSGALSEEIKWKNISDLKKAVESNGVGLSRSDMEGLNQFALAEYNRQNSRHENMPDSDTLNLLNRWFRIYESLKSNQTVTQVPAQEKKPAPLAQNPNSLPESAQTIPGETRRVDTLPEPVRYPATSSSPQKILGSTRRVDGELEVSRQSVDPVVPSKTMPNPQTLKDTEETIQESPITQSINRDLALALSAVRDEIREAKKVSSIKWNNKEGKAKIVTEIDSLIAQAMTLSPKDMVVKTHEILSKARTQSIIEKDQIVPLVSLYMANPPDAKKIRDAAVSIIRASNGSTQMHEIFYSRNANTIDARIAKFTSAEKDTLGKELNKLTSKMDHNLNKIAEKEWSVNSVEIKKQNPSMDLATFTKEYKENYRKYVQSDLERKLAIKLIGDVEFKKQDATLWNQYNSAVDPLDEWETFSDETATAAANFVVYDLTSMLISGGVAGLIGRGAVLATRGALGAGRVTEIAYGAGRINTAARGVGAVARAGIEGTAFTASHALVRNQEWFTSQPDWEKQIILGSLGFGLFRSAQSGVINNMFAGIKSPAVNGLVKQGLIIPAIITGVQVGAFEYDRIKNKDPDVWNEAWSNFLLNAALGGLFAFSAKGPTRVSNNAITEQTGFIKLQDRTVPMTHNADNTITLQVPGKGGAMKDITFKPSKELESQLRVPTAPAQPTSPVSTPNNAPRGPIPANQQPSLQDIKNYFATSDVSTAIIFTTKSGKYEYTFGRDLNGIVTLRKLKTEKAWEIIQDKDIPKNVQTQMRQRAGDPSAGTIPANPTTQPINTPNQAPAQQAANTAATLNSPALLEKQIEKSFKNLQKDGDTHDFGGITITKEGKKYRVKSEEGEFLISEKEAIQKIKNKLPQDIEKANKYLQDAVISHMNAMPVGKKMKYAGPEGESVLTKKADGTIEVVGPQGKILKGAELDAFYESQSTNILNQKMTSFLQKHGDEQVDPKKFSAWYGKERSWYNPVSWGKGIINLTWNEVMQPVKTYNAFLGKGGALRTLDNPFAMTNNIAKAIVLRDVNMNWFSTASAMRVIGRGTIMTGATAAAMNTTVGPNIVSHFLMTPTTFGYTVVSGDNSHTIEQHSKMAFSTYYGGMLWGTLLSQAIGGMPDGK